MPDPELSGELIGIADENLGWLSLPELTSAQRQEIGEIARNGELIRSCAALPLGIDDREKVQAELFQFCIQLRSFAVLIHDTGGGVQVTFGILSMAFLVDFGI